MFCSCIRPCRSAGQCTGAYGGDGDGDKRVMIAMLLRMKWMWSSLIRMRMRVSFGIRDICDFVAPSLVRSGTCGTPWMMAVKN